MAQHKERVAIVTGANSGIGEAMARRLAREGATVMLVARNPETLAEVADSIGKDGGRAAWHSTDLSRPESGEEIVTATLEKLGRIDFLVNCASATLSGPFLSFTDEQWVQGFSVKVFGAIRLFQGGLAVSEEDPGRRRQYRWGWRTHATRQPCADRAAECGIDGTHEDHGRCWTARGGAGQYGESGLGDDPTYP